MIEKKSSIPNDLIRLAIERAVCRYGSAGTGDGVFTSACFSNEFTPLAGVKTQLDGRIVRAMLTGRDDVEVLHGGAHFRMLTSL